MIIKYTNSFFALGIVTLFTLTGAIFSITRELQGKPAGRESHGRVTTSDDGEFLTRYYNQGASAGSTWETITNRE